MIGDFHSSGNKGITHFIHNDQCIQKIEQKAIEKFGQFPTYFELVLKVTSYNYSDFESEVILFNELSKN